MKVFSLFLVVIFGWQCQCIAINRLPSELDRVQTSTLYPYLNEINTDSGTELEKFNVVKKSEQKITSTESATETIVETLLVCDKEWADLFNHNKQSVRDYFSVYFQDVTSRFQTLPSANIKFVITGIIMITDKRDQPFIEEAKVNGTAEVGRIMPHFRKWLYKRRYSIPKFDIAIAFTNAKVGRPSGASLFGSACAVNHELREFENVIVLSDKGGWTSMTAGSQQIGHILGATLKSDENRIRNKSCSEEKFIMGGGRNKNIFQFSDCSDSKIANFLRSEKAVCLQRKDDTGKFYRSAQLSTNFDLVPHAFGFNELCQFRLRNSSAFVHPDDNSNCLALVCRLPNRHGGWTIYRQTEPVQGTRCGEGKICFRGQCIDTEMTLNSKDSLFQGIK